MKPAPFEFFRPSSLDEVFELLNHYGEDARLIAGGQSLIPMMNLRMARPSVLIDLGSVSDLIGISRNDTHVHIKAMTRQCDLLTDEIVGQHLPLVACATGHIGHFQTRNRGTLGGSLAHADPAAELPLVMTTLGANFKLQSLGGERVVPAREFFVDALTTAIAEGEVLTEIIVPVCPADGRIAFAEFARRHGDFAIASVAVQRSHADDCALIGIGGVGSVPHYCEELGVEMSAGVPEPDEVDDLIARELSHIEPMNDPTASGGYRRHIAGTLLRDCLQEVFGE